jgi:5-methylcytosine-specific restriction protein A
MHSRCDAHRTATRQQADAQRGTAHERGYSAAWRKAREGYLRNHPLCECPDCDAGRVRLLPASVVDHKVPHRGDKALFWDSANWQAMSKPCHDRKTAREDGGFGNAQSQGMGGRSKVWGAPA